MLEFLLEVLGDALVKTLFILPGGIVRYLLCKPFQPEKKLSHYFVDDAIVYNGLVGIIFVVGGVVAWAAL